MGWSPAAAMDDPAGGVGGLLDREGGSAPDPDRVVEWGVERAGGGVGCLGARVRGLRGGSGPAGWAGGGQLGHLAQQGGGLSSLFFVSFLFWFCVFFSFYLFSFCFYFTFF